MLILAGVSLNAIVGDNGIITNAQNANIKSGIAALEEWLQEEYVNYYEDVEKYFYYDDEGEKHDSKQELLASKINNLFLKDGTRNYIVNDGKVYYLINKSRLPDEIKNGLVGGNTTDYTEYTRLIDVYGVTDELKVYYYDSGSGTVYGNIEESRINLKNVVATEINSDTEAKKLITDVLGSLNIKVDETKGITVGNVTAIKDLKIDGSTYNLNSLTALSEIKNLKTLTLSNLTLSSLDGLEGCPNLYYIYFKNCNITDYSKLATVLGLQYLYIYLPSSSMNETIANSQITNLGVGLKDANKLSKLTYLGISRSYYNV